MSGTPYQNGSAASSRPVEDLYVLGGLSGLSAILLALTYPIWGAGFQVLCPLRELTGIPCPTCFGTRATLALIGGDWRAALRWNPLVAVGGTALLAYVPWSLATAAFSWPRPRFSSRRLTWLGWLGAGLVAVNWIYLVAAHV